jgi:cytochrome c553
MDNSQMQKLNTQQSDSVTTHFETGLTTQLSSFSSTKLGLKQRYMLDFLKDLKKSDVKRETTKEARDGVSEVDTEVLTEDLSQKEVLFQEIKGLLADF